MGPSVCPSVAPLVGRLVSDALVKNQSSPSCDIFKDTLASQTNAAVLKILHFLDRKESVQYHSERVGPLGGLSAYQFVGLYASWFEMILGIVDVGFCQLIDLSFTAWVNIIGQRVMQNSFSCMAT